MQTLPSDSPSLRTEPSPEPLDELLGYRPEAAPRIAEWRRLYLAGEVELEEFEEGVECALTGEPDRATKLRLAAARAEQIAYAKWISDCAKGRKMSPETRQRAERDIERRIQNGTA